MPDTWLAVEQPNLKLHHMADNTATRPNNHQKNLQLSWHLFKHSRQSPSSSSFQIVKNCCFSFLICDFTWFLWVLDLYCHGLAIPLLSILFCPICLCVCLSKCGAPLILPASCTPETLQCIYPSSKIIPFTSVVTTLWRYEVSSCSL